MASSQYKDELIEAIGEIGPWQLKKCLLLSLISFIGGWHILVINFQAAPTRHWCALVDSPHQHLHQPALVEMLSSTPLDKSGKEHRSQCTTFTAEPSVPADDIGNQSLQDCTKWMYDTSEFTSTIIIEWDIVCHKKWLQKVAQGIYMFGVMCGVMIWGIAADKYGRRPVLLSCAALTFVFAVTNSASRWMEMFLLLRFLTAFADVGAYMAAFSISMELVGTNWRSFLGIFFGLPASLGFMSMGAVGYVIKDWRTLQLVVALPSLLYIGYYWCVPESPRWLMSVGRDFEAEKIVQEICKANGTVMPEKFPLNKVNGEQGPSECFLDVFRNGRMTLYVLCLLFCWFVIGMVFYGILLNTEDFGTNLYLNAALAGAVEIPAFALSACAVHKLGRRIPIAAAMVGAGVCCLLTLTCNKGDYPYDWPIMLLAMLGKFCMTAAFGTIYIYSSEIFPTSLRNSGLGLCSVMARCGSILAPFLVLLRDILHPSAPILVFGGLAIISASTFAFLPETANRPMVAAIADAVSLKSSQDGSKELAEETRPLEV